MKKLAVLTLLGTSLCAMQTAKASVTLEQVLAQKDPVAYLESLTDQANVKTLCDAIKAKTFYEIAKKAGIGTIKQAKIVNFCESVKPEVAALKPATQKAKPAEPAKEVVKLKHVDFSKKGSAEEERATLQRARDVILENATQLGRRAEVEAQLNHANEALHSAQEHYDNLTAAVIGMREDLKESRDFKIFNPKEHDHDTPEQFLAALNAALPKEAGFVLTQASRAELARATQLLAQANENLANARQDLERINREMLQISK